MKKRELIIGFLCIVLLTSFYLKIEQNRATTNDVSTDFVVNSRDDLQITFEGNQSVVGKNGGVLANLNLENVGADPVGDIVIDFGLNGDYAEFTTKYPNHSEIGLINPGFSEKINIEIGLNETALSSSAYNASVDLCLVFDASGSMGAELDSVKVAFLDIVENMINIIPSLRIGVIIYGCSIYSEYPQLHPDNYIEFTDNFTSVNDFINSLQATGGVEPWGDALYLANSWSWRESARKLLIMVGDEDCDPGKLVGVGSTSSYYNGSQLLNVVTNLKEKGIRINTVITDISGIVVNQFNWIADYTNGECVDLEELQSGTNPVELPDLIETWTIELSREYFVDIYANITWIEYTISGNVNHEELVLLNILIDIAPPSISTSTFFILESDFQYTMQIYAEILDISDIQQAQIYWTYEDLEIITDPTWHFSIMTEYSGNTFRKELPDLILDSKISYYVIAIDEYNNIAETEIFNETVTVTPKNPSTTTILIIDEDNTTLQLRFTFELYSIGYIWFKDFQGSINFLDTSNFQQTIVYSNESDVIYEIEKISSNLIFDLSITSDKTVIPINILWTEELETTDNLKDSFYFDFTSNISNIVLETVFTYDGYLSLIPYSTELIAVAKVFDSNWNYIGLVSAVESVELESGKYFIWLEKELRTGICVLHYGYDPITTDNQYYTAQTPGLSIIIAILGILGLAIYMGITTIWKKNRKRGSMF